MDFAAGFNTTTSAVTGFKFAMRGGNMTGEFQIYGISK